MNRLNLLARLVLVSLVTFALMPRASAQIYPDSEKGLRKFMSDLLRAAEKGREADFAASVASLVLPDHEVWFLRVFGPADGAELADNYTRLSSNISANLYPAFVQLHRDGFRDFEVKRSVSPCIQGVSDEQFAVLAAQKSEAPMYLVAATRSEQLRPIGFFAFVEGSFRWLGNIRFGERAAAQASVKPIDMTRQAGNMISTVPAVYPREAKKKRIQGMVVLSTVIGTDGTVQSVFFERGVCELAGAAMAAVRQWRYKPTLLDGKPVPVTSTVEVHFTLSN